MGLALGPYLGLCTTIDRYRMCNQKLDPQQRRRQPQDIYPKFPFCELGWVGAHTLNASDYHLRR